MCSLYNVVEPQAAIREFAKATVDTSGNLQRLPSIFPDDMAPVVMTRPQDGKRELLMMRWGFPSLYSANGVLVTSVHNTHSPLWRPHLRPYFRCLVPVTSFCEHDLRRGQAVPTWFALDETQPLFFFAGIWCSWKGTKRTKANLAQGDQMHFSFLATEPNSEIGAYDLRSMPVLLLTERDRETWMNAPTDQALALQRPARNSTLKVVGRGNFQYQAAH